MRPIRWFTFNDRRGHEWSVVFATPRETKDLIDDTTGKALLGMADFASHTIFISAVGPSTEYEITFWHEFSHVTMLPADLPYWIEEPIAEESGRALAAVLMQLRFVLPAIPASVKIMRDKYRVARRAQKEANR